MAEAVEASVDECSIVLMTRDADALTDAQPAPEVLVIVATRDVVGRSAGPN
jgi:hypothetical protein